MQGQFKDEFVTAGGVPLSEVCAIVLRHAQKDDSLHL